MSQTILVTGGAGYIGSHTSIELMRAGHEVVILDNLVNSSLPVLDRVARLAGKRPIFLHADVRDRTALDDVFSRYRISAVIHFAGLKAAAESVTYPLDYYESNVWGSICLFEAMARHQLKTLVFSSSATVYGEPPSVPISEDFPLAPISPYGRTKLMIEEILRDIACSDPEWRIALLRYFNPVGAHDSGLIGEDPNDVPNNLMPYVSQVAIGRLKTLSIYGNDYPTHDGTGVRDYIHVVDLARGHLAAMNKLKLQPGLITVNLGTGRGYSVLELVRAFENASGKTVPFRFVERRPGDIASCFANPCRAKSLLNWHAERDLTAMCRDAWRWQSQNPMGYT